MAGKILKDRDVDRLRAMLRWFEAQPRSEPAGPGRTDRQQVARPAIATSVIGAGSATTAGSGSAKLQQRDAAGAYTTMQGPSGDVEVTVWNHFGSVVASGDVIYVFRAGDGWELLSADC